MGQQLHRLIYSSRCEISDADLEHEVLAIVGVSIRNNRQAAVTGLLLAHAGYFVQALEGPMTAVLTTYARICNDHRHAGPHVISAGPAERREFGDWNMCARRITPSDDAILDALSQRESFQPTKLRPASALRLLTTVRRIQDRSQAQALT